MDEDGLTEAERHRMEQIRELDFEELQVEEVDEDDRSSDGDPAATGDASSSQELAFDTSLASLHTYLGEVEDTRNRLAFLDGGAVLALPLFYLQGVVLFPDATLPLRLVQLNFILAVENALSQVNAPCTIGVVHVCRDPENRQLKFAPVGTTAEIRQYRKLEDGSVNVLARGQQRFRLRRRWMDADGLPFGEVQIIQEDLPLRMPKDAFGKLAPLSNLRGHSFQHPLPPNTSTHHYEDSNSDSEANSMESFETELSPAERRIHMRALDSCDGDSTEESSGGDDDESMHEVEVRFRSDSYSGGKRLDQDKRNVSNDLLPMSASMHRKQSLDGDSTQCGWKHANLSQFRKVPRAFWPYWVYQMQESYCLAERAADMWKQIVGAPSMDALVRKPDILSFSIASKIPLSESIRQELLEIDGISYRLRREIELLARFDLIRCRSCRSLIARRSDMLVMSTDGPLGAYVNPHGHVFEILTLLKANGLALVGRAFTEYSWFPGYAWTITTCAGCETQMGWLFTATKKNLKPRSFWGIRSSQVADDMN